MGQWFGGRSLRMNGVATVEQDDPLRAEYPEAQLVVRIKVSEVFGNCPRYVHKMQLVERSRFVPHAACQTPVPDWKTDDWARDVVSERAATPGWPRTLSMVEDAAFHLYQRGAVDYAP